MQSKKGRALETYIEKVRDFVDTISAPIGINARLKTITDDREEELLECDVSEWSRGVNLEFSLSRSRE